MHAQEKMRPAFKGPVWTEDYCRGRRAKGKKKDVTDCSNVQFFRENLCTVQTERNKTKKQILAAGLKCEKGGGNKREFELNEHALVA